MNDAFDQGYEAVTSYRNSKNFGSSWISAAYATWFIREARFPQQRAHVLRYLLRGFGFGLSHLRPHC